MSCSSRYLASGTTPEHFCDKPGHPYCPEHQREIDAMEQAGKDWEGILTSHRAICEEETEGEQRRCAVCNRRPVHDDCIYCEVCSADDPLGILVRRRRAELRAREDMRTMERIMGKLTAPEFVTRESVIRAFVLRHAGWIALKLGCRIDETVLLELDLPVVQLATMGGSCRSSLGSAPDDSDAKADETYCIRRSSSWHFPDIANPPSAESQWAFQKSKACPASSLGRLPCLDSPSRSIAALGCRGYTRQARSESG
jgi:hypothetical protein